MVNKTANGRWRVRVKSRGVVVADRTFVRRGDALRWEAEQTRLLVLGEFVPPSAGKMTVAELAEEYREARRGQLSVRGWESDESALRVHVVPAWGRLPIGSITAAHIERFLSHLATTRSVRTAARVRSTVRGLFAYAVRTRRLVISPARGGPAPPRPDSRTGQVVEIRPTPPAPPRGGRDPAEVRRPLRGRHPRPGADRPAAGSCAGLRVKDVATVPYPAIVVHRSVPQSGRTGAPIERATTKSGRTRLIPLSDLVRPVVAEWAHGRRPDDLLFPAPGGGYLTAQNWRRAVHWSATSLGRRPHDLRHTAASLWIAAGVDIKTVSSWLGHSTAKLTLDTYGHLMGTDADRAAMARVNAILGDATGTRPAPSRFHSPTNSGR